MKKDEKKNESRSFKKFKVWILVSTSIVTLLFVTLLIILITYLRDPSRSTYQRRGLEASEVIKKNYIDGFKDTNTTGQFTYTLPKEDINELLSIGVDSIENKHIIDIYYEENIEGYRFFYVDLKGVGLKTRVKFTTVPSIRDESTVRLSISSATIGKVNALGILERKGYLTSEFINNYFERCYLPITFDEAHLSFDVHPYRWVSMFPSTELSDYIFSQSKDISGAYSLNSNLFGFYLDISKLSNGNEFKDVEESSAPNIYEEVKQGLLDNFDDMVSGETRTIYSLSEEGFNKLAKSSFTSILKEEVTSTLTSNKVEFDLKGSNILLDEDETIKVGLFFLINGYIFDVESRLHKVSSTSSIVYKTYFEEEAISSTLIERSLNNVLGDLGSTYSYFEFMANPHMLQINLETLNMDEDISSKPDLKYSIKSIEINQASKTIDFKLTKAS